MVHSNVTMTAATLEREKETLEREKGALEIFHGLSTTHLTTLREVNKQGIAKNNFQRK